MKDYMDVALREFPKYEKLLRWAESQTREKVYNMSDGKTNLPAGYLFGVFYEAYMNAWREFDPEKVEGGFDGFKKYLNTCLGYRLMIANRLLLDRDSEDAFIRRRNRRTKEASQDPVLNLGIDHDVSDDFDDGINDESWEYYMTGLDDQTRRILRYRFVDDMTYTDIGRLENLPGNTNGAYYAKQYVLMGVDFIRRKLSKEK